MPRNANRDMTEWVVGHFASPVSRPASPLRGTTLFALSKIIQKFRHWLDSADQQVIPSACAGNVEQVPLGIVHLLQISIVTNRLDTLLQWDDLVVAGHHDHGAELQTFGEVHRAD